MGTEMFCKKNKYQIQEELHDIGFSQDQIREITDRMEDQMRDDYHSTVANFEVFCFELKYSDLECGIVKTNIKISKR